MHRHDGKICLQILHAGRYARQEECLGPSDIRSRINRFPPRAMTRAEIEQTISDYVRCAMLAREAGFDGVEIMGSEGYLINEFTVVRTNDRSDGWGGSAENRRRFPVELVTKVRAATGPDFIIIYRISAIDLVEGGATGEEIVSLAQKVEAAGADILNTGIGWHEARVPTIAYPIPRGAWRFAAARLKRAVGIPVVASNRINKPELAEEILSVGDSDLVSMARPLLADPHFARKVREGNAGAINVCIACNQACLDLIFSDRSASCLVNPRACRETEFDEGPAAKVTQGRGGRRRRRRSCGRRRSQPSRPQGHAVRGQRSRSAASSTSRAPFPASPNSTRCCAISAGGSRTAASICGSTSRRPRAISATATSKRWWWRQGVHPRMPEIPGIDHPKVVFYNDLLSGKRHAGHKVAIVGAGGIGFDVAEYLCHSQPDEAPKARGLDIAAFQAEWNIDSSLTQPGGLAGDPLAPRSSPREITLLQRRATRPGVGLGVSTGWILRSSLAKRDVKILAGVSYQRIDDAGLHIVVDGVPRIIEADTIVICAGQVSNRELFDELGAAGVEAHVIGGAKEASELDAMRAVEEGVRVAQAL